MSAFGQPVGLGELPLGAPAMTVPQPSAYRAMLRRPDVPAAWLVEGLARRPAGGGGGLIAGLGEAGLGEPVRAVAGEPLEAQVRWATRGKTGRPSDPERPNAFWRGLLLGGPRLSRDLPIAPEDPRRMRATFGELSVADAERLLDAFLAGHRLEGRDLEIFFGPWAGDFADFARLMVARVESVVTGPAVARLLLRDTAWGLDRPAQPRVFAGTGGREGPAELAGLPWPMTLGTVRYAEPVWFDRERDVGRVGDGLLPCTFHAAADGGYPLTLGPDFPSYEALRDATRGALGSGADIEAGQVGTCRAENLVRPGGQVFNRLTVDLSCGPTGIPQICLALLDRAGVALDRVDEAAWLNIAWDRGGGGHGGRYVGAGERPTFGQLLDWFVGGVEGWWAPDRRGRLRAGRHPAAETLAPVLELGWSDVGSARVEREIRPRALHRVGYGRCWTPLTESEIADDAPDQAKAFASQAMRQAVQEFPEAAAAYAIEATPPLLESSLADAADAAALASERGALWARPHRVWSVQCSRRALLADHGDGVRVTHPDLGRLSGSVFEMVGEDFTGRTNDHVLRLLD
jgi:hypothetical protein